MTGGARAVYILDAVRRPIGRYRGGRAGVRPDDLAATVVGPSSRGCRRCPPRRIDDVFLGDANGAGEDNRDVARMAVLLAGLPVSVPRTTVNRLSGSGMEAVAGPAGPWPWEMPRWRWPGGAASSPPSVYPTGEPRPHAAKLNFSPATRCRTGR